MCFCFEKDRVTSLVFIVYSKYFKKLETFKNVFPFKTYIELSYRNNPCVIVE